MNETFQVGDIVYAKQDITYNELFFDEQNEDYVVIPKGTRGVVTELVHFDEIATDVTTIPEELISIVDFENGEEWAATPFITKEAPVEERSE